MNFMKYHVSENLSIIDTESYTLDNQYYKDTRITDVIDAGTYTISFYTDSTSDNLPLNCSLEKGSSSGVTGDIAWFNRAPVGDMTVQTFTITEPACIWMRFVRTGSRITGSISVSRIRLDEGETPFGTWLDSHYIMGTSTDTLTTLPAVIYANATTATVGLKGNMEQTGIPTPDNPIMPQGTGERTAQLWDEEYLNGYYNSSNTFISANNQICSKSKIAVKPNTAYWLGVYSTSKSAFLGVLKYNENAEFIERVNTEVYKGDGVVFTTDASTYYININFGAYYGAVYNDDIIIAESSTPLPYEPYGIKIPISSANTTTPVYLGEVQTTRNIVQKVFTGSEIWYSDGSLFVWLTTGAVPGAGLCSHFNYGSTTINGNFQIYQNAQQYIAFEFRCNSITSLTDFKQWLADQYAAGTPVTVWYRRSTPLETIRNEPLRKIGNYADSLSNISIPVTAGGDTLSVDTTLQPSEVSVNYKGWHPVADIHVYPDSSWMI